MDWKPGLILRIKDYRFEDDNTTRDKYAIVLFVSDQEAYLIHSLTTSRNNPGVTSFRYGCSVHRAIPYFLFPANYQIGDQAFYFDKDTFIFFSNNVRKEAISKFELLSQKFFGVTALGSLYPQELSRLIKCALKSRLLQENIEKDLTMYKDSLR